MNVHHDDGIFGFVLVQGMRHEGKVLPSKGRVQGNGGRKRLVVSVVVGEKKNVHQVVAVVVRVQIHDETRVKL